MDSKQSSMFCLMSPESRVAKDHPLRAIKKMCETVLKELSPTFDAMYSPDGRDSVPPERLLKATVLMALYTIRSERQFCEQLDYNMLFRWFLDMDMLEPSFHHSTFSKNRQRLMAHDVAKLFFALVVELHSEKLSNDTHQSTTDPEARIARKGKGKEAKLAFAAHALMENRHGLLIDVRVTPAHGKAEREAALTMLDESLPGTSRLTLAGDKGFDARDFVSACRDRNTTPHVAQNASKHRSSAIDARTTRTAGYKVSQRIRKRVEEIFGWFKTVGNFRKTRVKGQRRNEMAAYFVGAAYNLLRIARLLEAPT